MRCSLLFCSYCFLSLVSCQSAELTELGKGDYNIETPLTHTGQEEEELHIAPSDKRGEKKKKNFRSSFHFFFFLNPVTRAGNLNSF